jgi:hypothetical protein
MLPLMIFMLLQLLLPMGLKMTTTTIMMMTTTTLILLFLLLLLLLLLPIMTTVMIMKWKRMSRWTAYLAFLMKQLLDGDFLRVEEEGGHVVVRSRRAEVRPYCFVHCPRLQNKKKNNNTLDLYNYILLVVSKSRSIEP